MTPGRVTVTGVALAAVLTACGGGGGEPAPGDPVRGAAVYAASCAECHGAEAGGSDDGPPLVDPLYRPDHHADGAFLAAVRGGVRPHHWDFGTMPPQEELSDADVRDVTAYVRQLQRAAGVD